jgi:hypothetical protein
VKTLGVSFLGLGLFFLVGSQRISTPPLYRQVLKAKCKQHTAARQPQPQQRQRWHTCVDHVAWDSLELEAGALSGELLLGGASCCLVELISQLLQYRLCLDSDLKWGVWVLQVWLEGEDLWGGLLLGENPVPTAASLRLLWPVSSFSGTAEAGFKGLYKAKQGSQQARRIHRQARGRTAKFRRLTRLESRFSDQLQACLAAVISTAPGACGLCSLMTCGFDCRRLAMAEHRSHMQKERRFERKDLQSAAADWHAVTHILLLL